MLVIHPDECIDCGVCVPECPVDAIKPDTEPGLSLSNTTHAIGWKATDFALQGIDGRFCMGGIVHAYGCPVSPGATTLLDRYPERLLSPAPLDRATLPYSHSSLRVCHGWALHTFTRGKPLMILNTTHAIGWKATDFALQGIDGGTYSLADVRRPKGTLVVFICNHCPYVKASISRIVTEANALREISVGTIAIMPNDGSRHTRALVS